jgi:phosphatidate cytidylyltransferase
MAAPAEPAKKRASSLTLRILSAAVLIPIVALAAYVGRPWWDALAILFGGVMIWEWCRIAARSRPVAPGTGRLIEIVGVVVVVAALVGVSVPGTAPGTEFALHWPRLLALPVVVLTILALPVYRVAALWFSLGVVYVLIPCVAIIALRADPAVGLQQILWIVALVIAADTGAYIAGRSIGGPKLAPRISPNKTWAGLGGAVVSAAIVGGIAAALLGKSSLVPLTAISGMLGIVAQAGDLAESAFKRHFGVKDASNIIPGHGGALDRVDGLIAVAAAVAGLNAWIGSSVLTWL